MGVVYLTILVAVKGLNRSIPIFPGGETVSKPKEQKLLKIEAPFIR